MVDRQGVRRGRSPRDRRQHPHEHPTVSGDGDTNPTNNSRAVGGIAITAAPDSGRVWARTASTGCRAVSRTPWTAPSRSWKRAARCEWSATRAPPTAAGRAATGADAGWTGTGAVNPHHGRALACLPSGGRRALDRAQQVVRAALQLREERSDLLDATLQLCAIDDLLSAIAESLGPHRPGTGLHAGCLGQGPRRT
jgi:hypothetical protein